LIPYRLITIIKSKLILNPRSLFFPFLVIGRRDSNQIVIMNNHQNDYEQLQNKERWHKASG
jgi:hypothetical protein